MSEALNKLQPWQEDLVKLCREREGKRLIWNRTGKSRAEGLLMLLAANRLEVELFGASREAQSGLPRTSE